MTYFNMSKILELKYEYIAFGKEQLARGAGNLTTICEPIVLKM
jgi:hypothetical protein